MRGYEDRREQYSQIITAETLKVSSSKTVRATNHHFHLSRSSPNMMKNKPPMALLSHGTRAHICVACRHSSLCKPVNVFWSSSTKKKETPPKKPVCFVWGCSAPLEMCLGICLSHLRQRFLQERTCGGGPGCFKVCLFDKLWIKCRDGCSKRRSYLRSWLWHRCVWKTEDATREKSQTKGGFASDRGNTVECCNLTVCLICKGERLT